MELDGELLCEVIKLSDEEMLARNAAVYEKNPQ